MGFNFKKEKNKPKLVVELSSIISKLTTNSLIEGTTKGEFLGISLTQEGNLQIIISKDNEIKEAMDLTPNEAKELIKQIERRVGSVNYE